MIRVMNKDLVRLGVIRNAIKASRVEQLNGENTLAFEAVLDKTLNEYLNTDTIFELRDDYFDLAMCEKYANENGTYTVKVEAEQVSYRLNNEEYNVENFALEGTPYDILKAILNGTGFTVGVVDFTGSFRFEVGGEVTRRQLLMQFSTAVKGDLIFEKFSIGVVKHRGSTERAPIVKSQHVKVVSQLFDKRELLPNGDYPLVYNCDAIFYPGTYYALGDDILLMERRLGIWEELRVVSITYNPYNITETSFTFANGPSAYYSSGIERIIEEQPPVDTDAIADEVADRVADEVKGTLTGDGLLIPDGGQDAQALIRMGEIETKWGNLHEIRGLIISDRLPNWYETDNKVWLFNNPIPEEDEMPEIEEDGKVTQRAWEINDIYIRYDPSEVFIPQRTAESEGGVDG